MPDIWTEHPELVRDLLREAGFTCGVEPRVLTGRDPEWTCILDGTSIAGDIYIHHLDAASSHGVSTLWLVVLGVLLVAVVCLASVIVRLKRQPQAPQPGPQT
jgi:hypothetical protein